MTDRPAAPDLSGSAAPPRRNGELVFAEPWESRAFGMAVALHEAGAFAWDDFRTRLIARIAEWERSGPPDGAWSYYRCWLRALEDVVTDRGLLDAAELDHRTLALAGRSSGHDHDHPEPTLRR